jgi:AcrR family transcriptional regulator
MGASTGDPPPAPSHPTAAKLLDCTVELLDSIPLERLNLAMVLDYSGVNQGSLYHHFGSFPGLVEQAIVFRYTRNLLASLEAVRSLLASTDADDFRDRAVALFAATIVPERRENRRERIEVLGRLSARPELAAVIARAQQQVTDAQAELYEEFQRRGWMRDDLDPLAQSSFVQAMILGRVVDDVAERPLDRESWQAVALPALRAVLFGD